MRLPEQPQLVSGPGLFASLLDWARLVVRVTNQNLADLLGFTVARSGTNGTQATIAPVNNGNGDARLVLNKVGTQNCVITASKSGLKRWEIVMANAVAEGGANAGSDFGIDRYNDAGALLANAMSVRRSDGRVDIPGVIAGGSSVAAAAVAGFQITGAFADGSNYASQVTSTNPNWETVAYQGYHVPGVWAGQRWVVGTTSPAVFEMRNNGTGYSVGGWVATSDGRFKINRQPLGDVLAWIDEVEPCEYDRTDVTNLDGAPVHRVGFIADHFESHAPALVLRDKSTDDNPDPIRSLDYDGAGAYLWRAVQQLKAQLAECRAEIEILKGNANG